MHTQRIFNINCKESTEPHRLLYQLHFRTPYTVRKGPYIAYTKKNAIEKNRKLKFMYLGSAYYIYVAFMFAFMFLPHSRTEDIWNVFDGTYLTSVERILKDSL